MTETKRALLARNGWFVDGHSFKNAWSEPQELWNHPEPGLRRVDGLPMFKQEAIKAQREKDRREVAK